MKEDCSGGASLFEGFHERDIEGGLSLGNPKDDVFERYAKCPVNGYLYRGPVGEPGGGSFAGNFERK